MSMLTMQSLCPAFVLPDSKADRRTAKRVEQYQISAQAIYFPGFPATQYLPFDAIRRAWLQNSSMALTGCCGKELPVVLLRIEYDGGFFKNFSFEKRERAEVVLSAIQAANPAACAAQ